MQDDIKKLISTFIEYRDLITPIEESLRAFSLSFDGIKEDIKKLNISDGGVQQKLDSIYKELSSQANNVKTLTSEVDRFLSSTNKYVSAVDSLVNSLGKIEKGFSSIKDIEGRAEEHIEKLGVIIDEKRKNYDVKSLEKKLESYSASVEKVSDYINKDVIDVISDSHQKIAQIQDKNNSIYESIVAEKGSIDNLIENYSQSNKLLKKIVESDDVNQDYIYDILDKWAEDRNVKIRKK